ncbi:MAG TPA: DUF4288 domain-containing protein [Pirellulales bacterium]|nr:DUF4288 domain-containing protein [Pirellulales bacterium]
MSWYAAHLVMFVEFKDTVQEQHPVWENIVLIGAASEEEAFEKAERHGRSAEGDECGSFRWGKKPAQWVFAGVRKLTECAMLSDVPGDGTEISFNELELASREDVRKLAQGKPVQVTLADRFPTTSRSGADAESKARKRKPA